MPHTEKTTFPQDVSEAMTSTAQYIVAEHHEGDVDSDEGPEEDGSNGSIGHQDLAWETMEKARMICSKADKDIFCEDYYSRGGVCQILLNLDFY